MESEISLKDLKFEFDLSKSNFQMDILQDKILQFYLRSDPKFRIAFNTNYTMEFFQYIKDKAKLREPYHLSTMGITRSGKSYSMISVLLFTLLLNNKKFSIDYVCANAYEFLDKLKSMSEESLKNSCFLIDEEKQAVYGYGSTAKKMKIEDVNNIIAINNISTIMLNPISFADQNAYYGLRTFGRDFNLKVNRFMMYNLQESNRLGTPLGSVYIPPFTHFIPKTFADIFEKAYLEKKQEWVNQEMREGQDVLSGLKNKMALQFMNDNNYKSLKKKGEKMTYISMKLGSEWTTKEIEQIFNIINLMEKGFL